MNREDYDELLIEQKGRVIKEGCIHKVQPSIVGVVDSIIIVIF